MAVRSHEPILRDPAARQAFERLELALRAGTGHVVVTAGERAQAAQLVDAALERSAAIAVLRFRAASIDPLAAIDDVASPRGGSRSMSERHEAVRELLEKARSARSDVFAVVEDADVATAEDLERVRMAMECEPNAIARMRVVLVGTALLDSTLEQPAATALASRIGTHVRFGPARRGMTLAALDRLAALRPAAAGMITEVWTSLFGRTQSTDAPQARRSRASPAEAARAAAPFAAGDATRSRRSIVMEVAVFKDAEPAYALQKRLAARIDRVLVVRLDAPGGTVYSVRVVGLDTAKEVAHAEREIRTLGHRSVRLGAERSSSA
jgi:hypothetical protein